jgi:hypothetical protein
MNRMLRWLVLGSILLLFTWSDMTRFCRHQMINLKFRVSAMKAAAAPPIPDTVTYVYTNDPEIADFEADSDTALHGNSDFERAIDPAVLAAAVARMDSNDAPVPLTWANLKDVKYKKRYNKAYQQYFDYPTFGAKLKAFDGKKVSIKGYMIPIDEGMYALSKNPYASCFFCGNAGPESVMDITFAHLPKRYKTDEYLTLRGVFKLNDSDVSRFMYQLYAVEVVK